MSKSMPPLRRSIRLQMKAGNKPEQQEVHEDTGIKKTTSPTKVPSKGNMTMTAFAEVLEMPRFQTTLAEVPDMSRLQVIQAAKSTSSKCQTKYSKSQRSNQELQIRMQMKKKELEFKHQQEMLDLELAMQLAKADGEAMCSEKECKSIGNESIGQKPDILEWVSGKSPWNTSDTVRKDEVRPGSCNIPVASSQIAKILTRQSMSHELPSFSGNPIEWPNFIAQYKTTTEICGYTKEENQCRLQKCLKGQARKIVSSLLILPDNVDTIIKILENRFGRPEHIVFMLLDKVKRLPSVKSDRLETVIDFSDEIKNVVGTIESLKQTDHLHNPILLQELLNKLPTSQKLQWAEYFTSRTLTKPKLVEFSLWLEKKANIACEVQIPRSALTDHNYSDNYKGKKSINNDKCRTLATDLVNKTKTCLCCNDNLHHLSICPKFLEKNIDERWNFITTKKLCFSCLNPYHNLKSCRKVKKCGENNCNKPHHKLLHKNDNSIASNSNDQIEPVCQISTKKNILLKVLPIILSGPHNSIQTYALLDDGSTVTLLDQDLADELNLEGPQHPLCIQWTNDTVQQQDDSRVVTCKVSSPQIQNTFQLRHIRTMKEMSLPTQTVDVEEICKKYPYVGSRISSMFNAKPRLLIGQDNWPLLVTKRVINGPWEGPVLSKTLLGWTIHGNVVVGSKVTLESQFTCLVKHEEKDDLDILHDLIKQQWQIDNLGLKTVTRSMSKEDVRAQKILDSTMKRIGDKFETGLLWKDEGIVLPESKFTAIRRLIATERKIDKNPKFAQAYCEKMKDLQKKGYIRKVNKEEAEVSDDKMWYLPHFGVLNPHKPNKLRIVFDAASKANGLSLNDCLLSGPDLYNSLFKILLNFRIKKFAFTADIKEMFLQVQVRKEDRFAQRFLWREMDRQRSPDVFEIGVVFFGSTCGPCLAQEAKNRNATDYDFCFS